MMELRTGRGYETKTTRGVYQIKPYSRNHFLRIFVHALYQEEQECARAYLQYAWAWLRLRCPFKHLPPCKVL